MDANNIFNVQTIGVLNISALDIMTRLFMAFILSIIISFIYRLTHKGFSYSYNMVVGIVICSLIVTMVLMVIDNSISRAFGLVGALSIIRFRTPIKDLKDIVFLFFAIAIGIACGAGAYKIGIISTLTTTCITYILFQLKFGQKKQDEFLVKVIRKNLSDSDKTNDRKFDDILERFARMFKVIEVSSIGGGTVETIYDYKFKDTSCVPELMNELNKQPGVEQVYILSAKHNLDIQ